MISKMKKYIAFTVSILQIIQTSALAQISPNSNETTIYQSANGVAIINIKDPNANGVSHNTYNEFNVGNKGAVLNNATLNPIASNSQLAGSIAGNPNLRNQANLIINEVTQPNPSKLNGWVEVLGKSADVVIANPYGITCFGCGFINTPRITLTTGYSSYNENNNLFWRITKGEIFIDGDGLNANQSAMLDLAARSIKLNSQINAKELAIYAGSNNYDYINRAVQPIESSDGRASYAIDTSLLGGMYAEKIKIIANESGVGVKMRGEMAANAGEFSLSSEGKIEILGSIAAKNSLKIIGNEKGDQGIKISDSNLTSEDEEIKIVANGNLGIEDNVNIQSRKKGINITANRINITGSRTSLSSENSTEISASDEIKIAKSTITSNQSLLLNAKNIDNSGVIQADAEINIKADEASGNFTNSGESYSGGATTINANYIDNKGDLTSADNFEAFADKIINTNVISSGKNVNLNVDNLFENGQTENDIQSEIYGNSINIRNKNGGNVSTVNNRGDIYGISQGGVSIKSSEVLNNGLILSQSDDINISSSSIAGSINNLGDIQARKNINLDYGKTINSGNINSGVSNDSINQGAYDVNIKTGSLVTSGNVTASGNVILSAGESIDIEKGRVYAQNDIRIEQHSPRSENNRPIKINIGKAGTAQVASERDVLINRGEKNNDVELFIADGSQLYGKKSLSIIEANSINYGVIASDNEINFIENKEIVNNGKIISNDYLEDNADNVNGKINITARTFINNTGSVASAKNSIDIKTNEAFTNDAQMVVNNGNIKINSKFINNNSNGVIYSSKNVEFLSNEKIANQGQVQSEIGNINLSGNSITNSGKIFATKGEAELNSIGDINNKLDGEIYAESNIASSTTGNFINQGLVQSNTGVIDIESVEFGNAGNIYANNKSVVIKGNSIENNNDSTIYAKEDITLTAIGQSNNAGNIITKTGDINSKSVKFINRGEGVVNTELGVTSIDAQDQFINSGKIYAIQNDINVSTKEFITNSDSIMHSNKITNINVSDALTNSGGVFSNGNININVSSLPTTDFLVDNRSSGTMLSTNGIFEAKLLDSSISRNINYNNKGTLGSSTSKVAITAKDFDNSGTLLAGNGGKLDISGNEFVNSGNVYVLGKNANSDIPVADDLEINAVKVNNTGNIYSIGNINIKTKQLDNAVKTSDEIASLPSTAQKYGAINAVGNINIVGQTNENMIVNSSLNTVIGAGGVLNITSANGKGGGESEYATSEDVTINNQGNIGGGRLNIKAKTINNDGVLYGGDLGSNIEVQTINNSAQGRLDWGGDELYVSNTTPSTFQEYTINATAINNSGAIGSGGCIGL